MSRWTCPHCDREFARRHQAHVCVPGGTVEATFAGRAPAQRAAYDAMLAHLRRLGPVHEDAVAVGVFLKQERKFAEVRPSAGGLRVWLLLPGPLVHARFDRTVRAAAGRYAHRLTLRTAAEVDGELLGWLTRAYHAAGPGPG